MKIQSQDYLNLKKIGYNSTEITKIKNNSFLSTIVFTTPIKIIRRILEKMFNATIEQNTPQWKCPWCGHTTTSENKLQKHFKNNAGCKKLMDKFNKELSNK